MHFAYLKTQDHISIRYGFRPCKQEKKCGTVILLGGRKDFIEKYLETIGQLNHRGFDVYSFDWRGQGLSTRMLSDRRKGFVKSYEDYINDLELFYRKIVKPNAVSPVIILAHSMGSHIALRFLHDYPGTIDKAIFESPMFGIHMSAFNNKVAILIAWLVNKLGLEHAYAIGSNYYSNHAEKFAGNQVTSDPKRFMDEKNAIAENPDLALGGVTYGWVAATFESIDILMNPGYLAEITTPILIVGGSADRIVSVEAQKTVCSQIKNCKFVLIPHALHEILKETDSIQSIFWSEVDEFISQSASLHEQKILPNY
ncbi:MAG: alpha/beta hydrolase [Desulfobacterales bacterium]|nr:alpha/beta hydrolase [Desulfobacterales bacterium]